MATLYRVPTPAASNETIRVSLDGSTYVFRWLWNERDNHWFFDLSTSEDDSVAKSLRLVVGWNLLQDVTSENAPPGQIIAFDESTSSTEPYGEDPGENDLGDRVFIYYLPLDAVEELSP